MPHDVLAETAGDGDFSKRHLVNPVLLRMLGDVGGQRVLDAGCGNGYFSRMLARRGANVTGIERASALFQFAVHAEETEPLGIRYLQADLCELDAPGPADLGGPFDAVVASTVLHPCFEQLAASWREHGAYRVSEYLRSYEIELRYATDFHRPLSSYLNR